VPRHREIDGMLTDGSSGAWRRMKRADPGEHSMPRTGACVLLCFIVASVAGSLGPRVLLVSQRKWPRNYQTPIPQIPVSDLERAISFYQLAIGVRARLKYETASRVSHVKRHACFSIEL